MFVYLLIDVCDDYEEGAEVLSVHATEEGAWTAGEAIVPGVTEWAKKYKIWLDECDVFYAKSKAEGFNRKEHNALYSRQPRIGNHLAVRRFEVKE